MSIHRPDAISVDQLVDMVSTSSRASAIDTVYDVATLRRDSQETGLRKLFSKLTTVASSLRCIG